MLKRRPTNNDLSANVVQDILCYFDAIRFSVIDSMHNLFLGTAKHLISIWKDQEMISKNQFQHIQKKVEMMNIPLDIGRIPYKIESGMASLTADQ